MQPSTRAGIEQGPAATMVPPTSPAMPPPVLAAFTPEPPAFTPEPPAFTPVIIPEGAPDAAPVIIPEGAPDAAPVTIPEGAPDRFPAPFPDAPPDEENPVASAPLGLRVGSLSHQPRRWPAQTGVLMPLLLLRVPERRCFNAAPVFGLRLRVNLLRVVGWGWPVFGGRGIYMYICICMYIHIYICTFKHIYIDNSLP